MPAFLTRLFLTLFYISALVHADTNPTWTTTIAPFQIADNLYYVGSQDLASYLVVTSEGNILINANIASSPPQIRASVEKLGFRWNDIKILGPRSSRVLPISVDISKIKSRRRPVSKTSRNLAPRIHFEEIIYSVLEEDGKCSNTCFEIKS